MPRRLISVSALLLLSTLAFAEEKTSLFDGKTLHGWKDDSKAWIVAQKVRLDPQDPKKLAIDPGEGIFVNGTNGKAANLFTEKSFGDVEAHIEFCIPQGSNSGVYFQGRYEIQILDSYGKKDGELKFGDCGGIYQRYQDGKGFDGHAPKTNACAAPGEWQTFEVTFRAPRFDKTGKKTANATFVKVVHNGKLIHENAEISGPTRAAAFNDEQPTGPIMLQGDHGPVAFRKFQVREVKE